jgi:hypothetical protein
LVVAVLQTNPHLGRIVGDTGNLYHEPVEVASQRSLEGARGCGEVVGIREICCVDTSAPGNGDG